MEYNYDQRGNYHRGFVPLPQNRSRGRGRGYSRDMNSISFTQQGEYLQSNQNQECMYPTDRRWDPNYGTEMRTLSHRNQMSVPPQERHHVSDKGQQDIVRLSETLAFLLRHGAKKLGFHFMPGGFLYVDQLLEHYKPLKGFTPMQIKELVRTSDKQQFALQEDVNGRLMIRANQGRTTAGQQDIVRLSKTLAFLLRHGAENLGFHFMPGGFLYVDQLLKYHKPLKGFTLKQIEELVRTNDKQRFALKKDDVGRLMIRANQGHTTAGQQDIVRLSKTLAFLLRHGAEKLGFHFMPGGFLYVDQLLKYHKPLKGFTLKQIEELVRTNDKQRFALKKDDVGRWMIRANQGHTTAVEGLDLSPIYDSSEVQMVVHGTYYQAWDQIQNTGLSRMNRNHIHFAAGMPGESGVISGMRKSCEVVIEIDLEKALIARIPFFRSANNVILSPGNEKGFIPPTFFKRVFDRHSGEELMPLDFLGSNSSFSQNISLPSVQVAAEGWSLQRSLERMREESSDGPRSKKARYEKEGSSSKSDTLQYEKGITQSGKLHNEKDKEKAKQMRSKDETGDRGKSRSDRDEKEGVSESQNENERNMARQMRAQDEKEEISKLHDAKAKERTVQVKREDEKEVGETSKYRSGKGKGERIKFRIPAWRRTNEGNKKTT